MFKLLASILFPKKKPKRVEIRSDKNKKLGENLLSYESLKESLKDSGYKAYGIWLNPDNPDEIYECWIKRGKPSAKMLRSCSNSEVSYLTFALPEQDGQFEENCTDLY